MKELNDTQKRTIWTMFAEMVGFSTVKLMDYKTKDGATISINDDTQEVQGDVADGDILLEDGSTLTITNGKLVSVTEDSKEEVADEIEVTDATAELDSLKQENETLKAENDDLKKQLEEATGNATVLQTQLTEQETKPADKKVTLSAQSGTKSKAEMAWENYQNKK